MSNGQNYRFTKEDVETLREWSLFVADNASFELTVPDMIKSVSLMQRYNRIVQKVEAHILELQRVIHPETEDEPAPEKGKKRGAGK